MAFKHNKCCCTPNYFLYVGYSAHDVAYTIDPATQTYSTFKTGLGGVRSIAVDPTTGYVYFGNSATGVITCVDSSGTTIWTSSTAVSQVAVSNDGYLYVASGFYIRKLQANDGTEITTGGWPYSLSTPTDMVFWSVAVDQSGNVYAGGLNSGRTIRALSVTSSASLRWSTPLRNTLFAADTSVVNRTNIAVNAAGDECVCTRVAESSEPTVHGHYEISASTGGTVGSTRLSAPSVGGQQNGLPGAAYGPSGDSYGVATADASGHQLVKNVSGTGYFIPPKTGGLQAIAVGRDGEEYYVQLRAGGDPTSFGSVLGGWDIDLGINLTCIAASDGLIGAFGL